MLVAISILLLRNAIILGLPLPLDAVGTPELLLANKLQGWLHPGTPYERWSWSAWAAALLWEWSPALLFTMGLWRLLPHWRPRLSLRARTWLSRPWLPAGLLLVISSFISLAAFQGIPHVQDSIAQQFQAQIFASGRLWAPVPPEGWLLRSEYMVQHDGRWFSQYPPGHAALLALGSLVGVPWLVCPLMAAASAVLLFNVGLRAYGRSTASLAVWLFCLSPYVCFMSGERMNHVSALFWVLLALSSLAPALRRRPVLPAPRSLLAAGLFLGIAVSTRPLCGAGWIVVAAASLLTATGRKNERGGFEALRSLIAIALGVLAGAAPLFAFNACTTGSPWLSGYELQWGSTGWGFGRSQWGPPHTLAAGLGAAGANWDALGKYLYEWPLPGTVLLLGCLGLPCRHRADRVLAAGLGLVTLAYIPYFFQDLCLGPRFLYAALPAIVLLSARGAMGIAGCMVRRGGARVPIPVRTLPIWLALLTAAGVVTQAPVLWKWYASDFWGTSTRLVREVERQRIQSAVVFIRDRGRLRCEELRRRGVPLSVAQSAVDMLDPAWVDTRVAVADARRESPGLLTVSLAEAVDDPLRSHHRTTPPWMEAAGSSANVNFGFWANTPYPSTQSVIYALHPGRNLAEVLRSFPGRSFWIYDWDPATRQFHLLPLRDAALTPGR